MLTDFAIQLISSASVSVALSGLLLWITKSWISERLQQAIKSEYDQKLETHKEQLKAQSEIEIEKLRSQLRISATEHEILFSRLHEKRAEVIAEIYQLLKNVYARLANYVKPFVPAGDTPKEQRRKEAEDAHQEFQKYYATKLIFLPKATATKLEEIDLQLVKTFNDFVFGVEMTQSAGGNGFEKWIQIFERVNVEIKVALGELEDELRRLMGDESSQVTHESS
jgi:Fe-S cluster assembly scaffold protein SufB